MIQDIKTDLPDAEVLLLLAPQELARVLLPIFKRHRGEIHLFNLVNHLQWMAIRNSLGCAAPLRIWPFSPPP